jgi:hypothetical protein
MLIDFGGLLEAQNVAIMRGVCKLKIGKLLPISPTVGLFCSMSMTNALRVFFLKFFVCKCVYFIFYH